MMEQGKRIGDSRVTISPVMLPSDANIHGGVIMKLVDDASAIVATSIAAA
jgi:acyl-CoA hydrolase